MKDLTKKKGPIGPVVRKADYVFTNLARRTVNNGTFNRLDWHLFNFLHEKKRATADETVEYLSFFDHEQAIRKVLNRFLTDGLTMADPDGIAITPKGVQVYAEVSKIQEQIKEKAFKGISESAYATTIDTLQKITNNLSEYLPDGAISTKDRSAGTTKISS